MEEAPHSGSRKRTRNYEVSSTYTHRDKSRRSTSFRIQIYDDLEKEWFLEKVSALRCDYYSAQTEQCPATGMVYVRAMIGWEKSAKAWFTVETVFARAHVEPSPNRYGLFHHGIQEHLRWKNPRHWQLKSEKEPRKSQREQQLERSAEITASLDTLQREGLEGVAEKHPELYLRYHKNFHRFYEVWLIVRRRDGEVDDM